MVGKVEGTINNELDLSELIGRTIIEAYREEGFDVGYRLDFDNGTSLRFYFSGDEGRTYTLKVGEERD